MRLTKKDFENIQKLIELSELDFEAQQRKIAKRRRESGETFGFMSAKELSESFNDPELNRALDFIETLSWEQKKKYGAVMYAGREVSEGVKPSKKLFDSFNNATGGYQLSSKALLHEYLTEGLKAYKKVKEAE